jgi:hypothetical protein
LDWAHTSTSAHAARNKPFLFAIAHNDLYHSPVGWCATAVVFFDKGQQGWHVDDLRRRVRVEEPDVTAHVYAYTLTSELDGGQWCERKRCWVSIESMTGNSTAFMMLPRT